MTSQRVVLVDGSALIFRAFYALPANLSTSSGLPTNAIFGFATMFRKMFAGKTPAMGAVVFDAPGPNFRHALFPEYKAQRSRMPDDLRIQLPWIFRLVDAYRFPQIRVAGYEADDVIGTLTRQAVEAGHDVHIVTADKDFAQLVGPHVRMIDTLRDVVYDAELVAKKWGVSPGHMTDFLALVGDAIDNVPGVPGIGKKTAAALIAAFGTVENLLDHHLEDLKGARRQRIEANQEQLRLSKKLVTIDQYVPVEQTVTDLVVAPPDPALLNPLFVELQFYSLISDEAHEDAAAGAQTDDHKHIASAEAFQAFVGSVESPQHVMAVVPLFEEPGPIAHSNPLVGLALAKPSGGGRYIPLAGLNTATKEAVRQWLADPRHLKVAHDSKRLSVGLQWHAMNVQGVVFDLRLASFLVDPTRLSPHRLDQLSREFLHRTVRAAKTVIGTGKGQRPFSTVPLSEATAFACHRADAVAGIYTHLDARLDEAGLTQHLRDHELPLSHVLAGMELRGVRVDTDELVALSGEFKQRLEAHERRVWELAGRRFNINSTKQLSQVLFEELKLPVIKRTKTGYSTNVEVLERLADVHQADIASEIVAYRKLAKLINTYTDVLARSVNPSTGRIHATFQQTVAATGRIISTDPDLQRTPVTTPEGRRIRKAFVTEPGWRLLSADWSQIELRLLAHFSDDALLREAFAKERDVHRLTAAQIFGIPEANVTAEQRRVGKTVNFATIYGQGATALGQMLKISRKQAKGYIARYFDVYAGVKTWLDTTIADAHDNGYVTTLLGRRRQIPELSSNSPMIRTHGERIAANTPIQGSAADICKLAMLAIHEHLQHCGLQAHLLLQIHDELVFETPEGTLPQLQSVVVEAMENIVALAVPLKVDVGYGDTWAEAH